MFEFTEEKNSMNNERSIGGAVIKQTQLGTQIRGHKCATKRHMGLNLKPS